MKPETLEEIKTDVELAKNMSSITDMEDLLDLQSRMISHLDLLQDKADELEFKSNQLRGKAKTLKEYIRVLGARRTELSISSSLTRKEALK